MLSVGANEFMATGCIMTRAALAAGIFHRREVAISEVKAAVRGAGYPVRD